MNNYAIALIAIILIFGAVAISFCILNIIEEDKKYKIKKERLDKYYKEFQEELKNAKTPTERYLVINKYMTKEDGEALRKDFEKVGQYINDSMAKLFEAVEPALRKELEEKARGGKYV